MTAEQHDIATLQQRLRLAHQARRAKERQLDDIRHALMDIGVIEEGDPYSHADLADVIRQLDSELNRPRVTCHARECPCPPGCGCCPATAETAPDLNAQLTEAEALAGRWEGKYFEMGEKRTADALAIQRVRNLLPPDPTEDDLCVGVRNSVLRATLGSLTEEQRWEHAAQKNGDLYSGAENQRDAAREQLAEARATIARCQAVARDWEFMSGRTAARRELLAALAAPTEEQR